VLPEKILKHYIAVGEFYRIFILVRAV